MNWTKVSERLPKPYTKCLVIVGGHVGVAYYDDFGFSADSSAYVVYADDDSGLSVTIEDEAVTHWAELPELPKA